MKPLSRQQATACENAAGGRCRCRCGGAFHGAGRTEDTGTLPLEDPHRSELTDHDRRELAEVWALKAAELDRARAGLAMARDALAGLPAMGEQLTIWHALAGAERQRCAGGVPAVPRSAPGAGARSITPVRAVGGPPGASNRIHAHRNEGKHAS